MREWHEGRGRMKRHGVNFPCWEGESRHMNGEEILPFVEPIYRFSCKRLSNRQDAEDLSGDILLHVLDGMGRYQIESLEAWVWRIAHNRYARFIRERKRRQSMLSEKELYELEDYCQVDEEALEEEYESVFCCLHTLSSDYRDIFMDYYIREMSVKQLSQKYLLPETTVKWRLNVGRSKIRERIGAKQMDKVYQRIHWNTNCCNGSMDSNRYLHTQIARAICQAAYEKPLTVEEISLCTGIPAMYIEDELPRLEYGDAVGKTGGKYETEFIIFRQKDRAAVEAVLEPMVQAVADYYEETLWRQDADMSQIGFYGRDFGMNRLGHILVPYFIRNKIRDLKENRLQLSDGEYPPRKDGGFGWFIVEETQDEKETHAGHESGCNVAGDDSGSRSQEGNSFLYYYWVDQYFDSGIYHDGGARWLTANGIIEKCQDGIIPDGVLAQEDVVRLLRKNLIKKDGECCRLNFPCFTAQQFREFCALFEGDDSRLDGFLTEWILGARKSFEGFVPKRLHGQINQWLSVYCYELVSYVVEELVRRGRLAGAEREGEEIYKPMTNGVFYIQGSDIHP